MSRRQQGRLRLSGLRLVVVSLSAVGLLTTYSALEIFRFGDDSAALNAGIAAVTARQQTLSSLMQALGAVAVEDTPQTRAALVAAEQAVATAEPDAAAALDLGLRDFLSGKGGQATATTGLIFQIRALADEQAEMLDAGTAAWNDASASLSRVLSVSLASIVVLLFTVVLRTLAYLSARDRTEALLRRATAEAEAANAAKTDFLATMSHEIRTPLTAIRGYSELLAAGSLSATQRDQLDRLRDANGALALLIDDILDLSKIEAGQFDLHPAPLDLTALVVRVLSLVQPTALEKGLALRAEVAPDVPRTILGDSGRLAQVLANLTNNAVKFTAAGQVSITVSQSGERLQIAVADTGIGIAAEDIPKLFKRFSQIDSSLSRSHSGTGLGLAISRALVERMGGDITVQSSPGAGTTFTVSLPLIVAQMPEVAPQDPALPAGRSGARILVVEDSPQNQDLIQAVLRRIGHHCTAALDGAEGVRLASTGQFDLVIMDMQMPVMDGIEATAAIRALSGPQGRVPILAVSANALGAQVAAMASAGADRHLAKPFAIADLARETALMLGDAAPEGDGPNDLDALDALVALLGRDWVRSRLTAVLASLDWTSADLAAPDLRRNAHRLIAEAGQLGLSALGEAAARLEQAIDARTDIAHRRKALAAAATESRALLPQLLAHLDRA